MIKTLQYLAANCESLYLRNESFISQTKAENKTTSWFLIWQGSVYYKISSVFLKREAAIPSKSIDASFASKLFVRFITSLPDYLLKQFR